MKDYELTGSLFNEYFKYTLSINLFKRNPKSDLFGLISSRNRRADTFPDPRVNVN